MVVKLKIFFFFKLYETLTKKKKMPSIAYIYILFYRKMILLVKNI